MLENFNYNNLIKVNLKLVLVNDTISFISGIQKNKIL